MQSWLESRIRSLGVHFFLALVFTGCTQSTHHTGWSTAGGTALGAGLGAIIGSQTGSAGAGVAIGAAAGALGGALIGQGLDHQVDRDREIQHRISKQQQQIAENQRLLDELRSKGADAFRSDRGIVVNLPDILFDFDRATLTHDADETMSEIADVLKTVPDRMISIEGHTDSVGSNEYNRALSDRRADTVARGFIGKGVSPRLMRSRGMGERNPIASNSDAIGRARNRRVEVIIE